MDYLNKQCVRCGMCSIITMWVYHIIHVAQGLPHDRKPDSVFKNSTWLLDKIVSCGPRPPGHRVYPSDTWSCYSIRIDGDYLRYHYLPGYGANTEYCSKAKEDNATDSEDFTNDYAALCRHLLTSHNVQRPLWAAMISNSSCDVTSTQRLIFVKTHEHPPGYEWVTYPPGSGYVETLQCMVLDT